MATDAPHPPLLSLRNVHVRFGNLRAVNDVSFDLAPGSLLGLIGPNGAGKTTLLRAVAGLQPLTHGRIEVMGIPLLQDNPAALEHLGFTPDTPPVYEALTVRRFLEFIARGYGMSVVDARERIDFWLERVWLSEKADQKIKGLSRGMRQRLGIARTLLPNPTVILLDEPAAGLDPAGRVQFRQLLVSLREQGKTLIVSSHILSDMADYCTHIGIMSAGQMHQFGTVDHVTSAATDARCRYTIILVDPPADTLMRVREIPEVTAASLEGAELVLMYHSDRVAAAWLLKKLLASDLAVASFAPNAPDLEEAYLRTGIRQVD